MGRILIGADNYTLREEYGDQNENRYSAPITGFWFSFDKPSNNRQIYTRIIIKTQIGANEYTFFSQLLNYDSQQLMFIIELNKSSYVIYDDDNPLNYQFHIGLSEEG
jgi:hypothetical protein